MNTVDILTELCTEKCVSKSCTDEKNCDLQSFSSLTSLQMSSGDGGTEKFLCCACARARWPRSAAGSREQTLVPELLLHRVWHIILVHMRMKLDLS